MEALRAEVADEAYASMTDAEVVTAINAVSRPAPVPAKDVRRSLLLSGRWPGIVDARETGASPSRRQCAINVVDTLASFEDFDLEDTSVLAAVTAGLSALVTEELITSDEMSDILSLGNNRQSRAAELGLSPVREGEVAAARTV